MGFSIELDNSSSPSLVRFKLGEDFTGDDFENWLDDYDKIMSAQTVITNVIVDTSQNKKVHNAIRRAFSKMDFPDKYPFLGWTVIWGESRVVATTVKFVSIANKDLKIHYTKTEKDALEFLGNLSDN